MRVHQSQVHRYIVYVDSIYTHYDDYQCCGSGRFLTVRIRILTYINYRSSFFRKFLAKNALKSSTHEPKRSTIGIP
jgi:hypothetical protein